MQAVRLAITERDARGPVPWPRLVAEIEAQASLRITLVPFAHEKEMRAALRSGAVDVAWLSCTSHVHYRDDLGAEHRPMVQHPAHAHTRQVVLALRGGPVASINDIRGKRLALYGPAARADDPPILAFLAAAGLRTGVDFAPKWNADDAAAEPNLAVLRALLGGTAEAGTIDAAAWHALIAARRVPKGAFEVVWTTPEHAGHTLDARPGLAEDVAAAIADAFVNAAGWSRTDESGYEPLRADLREARPTREVNAP